MYQQPLYDQRAMQSDHLYSQTCCCSLGQYNNASTVRSLETMGQTLVPVGLLNEKVVYQLVAGGVAPSHSAVASVDTYVSKKRECTEQQHSDSDDQSYIKKPLNAFMLFSKEQRPIVVAELNITDSAAVNTILGGMWKTLSKEEQAKYYQEAGKEKLRHAQRYPGWSVSDNYGKKMRKRQTCKPHFTAEASAFNPEVVAQEANKLCLTPLQTVVNPPPSKTGVMRTSTSLTVPVMEAPLTQAVEMGPYTSQTVVVKQPHVKTPEPVQVCNCTCHL